MMETVRFVFQQRRYSLTLYESIRKSVADFCNNNVVILF
nr:MAG TPA: hypothetical protein [Caudoviricetes sp.]